MVRRWVSPRMLFPRYLPSICWRRLSFGAAIVCSLSYIALGQTRLKNGASYELPLRTLYWYTHHALRTDNSSSSSMSATHPIGKTMQSINGTGSNTMTYSTLCIRTLPQRLTWFKCWIRWLHMPLAISWFLSENGSIFHILTRTFTDLSSSPQFEAVRPVIALLRKIVTI